MEFLDSLWLLAIINSVLDSVMCVYIYISPCNGFF